MSMLLFAFYIKIHPYFVTTLNDFNRRYKFVSFMKMPSNGICINLFMR